MSFFGNTSLLSGKTILLDKILLLCYCCSVAMSCPTLCNPGTAAYQAPLSSNISWNLDKITLHLTAINLQIDFKISFTRTILNLWIIQKQTIGKTWPWICGLLVLWYKLQYILQLFFFFLNFTILYWFCHTSTYSSS